ncbi:ROK family protein [Streptomyces sp. HUCO-GS316]|nr:ROK family protein [Streptomyces sp. HUCO-GS316]MXM66137.1 ROK family protein [Streptomyces sp. HUCO-GS316]
MTRPAHVVAVDLGGTTIKAARYRAHGIAEETLRLPTPVPKGPDAVTAAVVKAATVLIRPGVRPVGRCAPGLIDTDAGIIRFASNLGLRDTPLAAAVADAVRLPVTLEHDVRAACPAERQHGLGAGLSDLLVVVLGTGLAAGIVSNGRLTRGGTGTAGEFGHIPVHADGELCACGQRGCVEAYTAAGALVRRYRPHRQQRGHRRRHHREPGHRPCRRPRLGRGDRRPRSGTGHLDPPARSPTHRPGGRNDSGRRPSRRACPQEPATRAGLEDRTSRGDLPLGADAGLLGAALHAATAMDAAAGVS